jgi:hypothetical protein
MGAIFIPSAGPDAWKQFLAKPDLHWAVGYSARTLAHSWEAAQGLPPEVVALLEPLVGETELLLAIPEHKVPLPGGARESQSDVFALIRSAKQTIACAIEGKVDEAFGPTLQEWLAAASPGKLERLAFIRQALGLPPELDGSIRYQLLHRTASAVIEAERFMTSAAAMIVHSFSPQRRWFEDFRAFAHAAGEVASDLALSVLEHRGDSLCDQRTICEAVEAANGALYEAVDRNPERCGMGTTLAGAVASDTTVAWLNVGDSRIYLMTASGLRQLSTDHAIGSRLTKALGGSFRRSRVCPAYGEEAWSAGDRLLLCSDGLTNLVLDAELEQLLRAEPDSARAVRDLLRLTLTRGAPDNVTLILATNASEAPDQARGSRWDDGMVPS